MRTESDTGPAAVGKLLQQLGRQFATAGETVCDSWSRSDDSGAVNEL